MGLFDFFKKSNRLNNYKVSPKKPADKEDLFEKQYQKNQRAIKCEKNGDIERAKMLYQEVIDLGFDGSHPYNRLAIIYRKEKNYEKEVQVLERAVRVYENTIGKQRPGMKKKLDGFKERLEKAKQLKSKSQ